MRADIRSSLTRTGYSTPQIIIVQGYTPKRVRLGANATNNPLDPAFWDPTNKNNLIGGVVNGLAQATGTQGLLDAVSNLGDQNNGPPPSVTIDPMQLTADQLTKYSIALWGNQPETLPAGVNLQDVYNAAYQPAWGQRLDQLGLRNTINAAVAQINAQKAQTGAQTFTQRWGNQTPTFTVPTPHGPITAPSSLANMSTTEKVAIGAGGVALVGLVIYALTRQSRQPNPRRRARKTNAHDAAPKKKKAATKKTTAKKKGR